MNLRFALLLALLPLPAFSQIANRATLTLVEEDGFNEVDIALDVEAVGPSNDQSILSGTIEVQVNIAPANSTTNELTILSADVQGDEDDPIALSANRREIFIVAEYSFTGTGLGFSAVTKAPPGQVDPSTGEFDASDHEVTVNRGMLAGTYDTILTDEATVSYDFAAEPFTGEGAGTGTITITPGRKEGIRQYYDLVLELPVDFSQEIADESLPVTVNGAVQGTLKAAGETFLDIPDYEAWATEVGVPTDSQNDFDLAVTTPNYILFALGHDENSPPSQLFSMTSSGITLEAGSGFALGDLTIEWSEDLVTWTPVPQSAMTSGSSSISFGDPLDVATTIGFDSAKKYFRVLRTPSS